MYHYAFDRNKSKMKRKCMIAELYSDTNNKNDNDDETIIMIMTIMVAAVKAISDLSNWLKRL